MVPVGQLVRGGAERREVAAARRARPEPLADERVGERPREVCEHAQGVVPAPDRVRGADAADEVEGAGLERDLLEARLVDLVEALTRLRRALRVRLAAHAMDARHAR